MAEWFQQKEQSAGRTRLLFLWLIYRIFSLRVLKIVLFPIILVIYLFAKEARSASHEYKKVLNDFQRKHKLHLSHFSTFSHILSYGYALADKISVFCDVKSPIKYEIEKDCDWKAFKKDLKTKKGIFLISSHLGNVEVFSGYSRFVKEKYRLNALMETTQSSIFRQFLDSHAKNHNFLLHSTEEITFDKIMQLYEKTKSGEIILMAGDRVSAENPNQVITNKLLDKESKFPLGTFKFALKFAVPTYAIFITYLNHQKYRICIKKISKFSSEKSMVSQYASYLEREILDNPKQWYNFYSYFS